MHSLRKRCIFFASLLLNQILVTMLVSAMMGMTAVAAAAAGSDSNNAGLANDPLIRAMKEFSIHCDRKLLAAAFSHMPKIGNEATGCFLSAIKMTRSTAKCFLRCSTAHLAITTKEVASELQRELALGEKLYEILASFERYNKERIIKLFAGQPEQRHRLLDRLFGAAKLWDRVLNRVTILCKAITAAPLEPPPPEFPFELNEAIRRVRSFLRKMQRLVTLAELAATAAKCHEEAEGSAKQLSLLVDRLPEDFGILAGHLASVFQCIVAQGAEGAVMNLEQAELMALLDSFDLIGNSIFLVVMTLEEVPPKQRPPKCDQLIWRILRLGKDLLNHPFWSTSTVPFYPRHQETREGYSFTRLNVLCETFKLFKKAGKHSWAGGTLVRILRRLVEDSYWYTLGHPDGEGLRQLALQAVEKYSKCPRRALDGGRGRNNLEDPVQAVCRIYVGEPRVGLVNWSLLRMCQTRAALQEIARWEEELEVAQTLEKCRLDWRRLLAKVAAERGGEGQWEDDDDCDYGDDDYDHDDDSSNNNYEETDGHSGAPFVSMPGANRFWSTLEVLEKRIEQDWAPLLGMVAAVELVGDEGDRMEGFALLTALTGGMRMLERICWPVDGVLAILDQYEGEDDTGALWDFILIKGVSIKIWGLFRRFDQQRQRLHTQLSAATRPPSAMALSPR